MMTNEPDSNTSETGYTKFSELTAWLPEVYDELRRIARHHLQGSEGKTLRPTMLVHEAYLRFADGDRIVPTDRARFLAYASQAMRRILIDTIRERRAHKRGGDLCRVSMTEQIGAAKPAVKEIDILALDQALDRLARLHPRPARAIEMRFFGGQAAHEIAQVLDVSLRTVESDLALGRAWLGRELAGGIK